MTAGVTDLHVELWIDLRAAQEALAEKDTPAHRAAITKAYAAFNDVFDLKAKDS